MSKAILIMDMPDNCSECKLHTRIGLLRNHYCVASNKYVTEYNLEMCKPFKCPLVGVEITEGRSLSKIIDVHNDQPEVSYTKA